MSLLPTSPVTRAETGPGKPLPSVPHEPPPRLGELRGGKATLRALPSLCTPIFPSAAFLLHRSLGGGGERELGGPGQQRERKGQRGPRSVRRLGLQEGSCSR